MPRPDLPIQPFGEGALLVELDGPGRAQLLDAELRRSPPPWLRATTPALASVLVEFDPLAVDADAVRGVIAEAHRALQSPAPGHGRLRTIPVVYGGEHGPDLDDVARLTGRSAADVVALHSGSDLRVLFAGFAPGFAYLGELAAELSVPRLETPRTRTPAGAVAIAGTMSGIYPSELPGGWRVIGRTPILLFDPQRDPPAYLVPGDRVGFEPITAADWDGYAGAPTDW